MKEHPSSLSAARRYRYGRWGGNPNGRAYREGYCIKEVFSSERGHQSYQCLNKGTPYCGIHKPGAAEARAAKRPPTKFEKAMADIERREQVRRDMHCFRRALTAIAGMRCRCRGECPHAIAKKAIESAVRS